MKKQSQEAQLKQRHMAHEVCVVLFLFLRRTLGDLKKKQERSLVHPSFPSLEGSTAHWRVRGKAT